MKLKIKNLYIVLTSVFLILTIMEIVKYFFSNSSLFGLLYILISIFISFLLIMVTKNYDKADVKKRISKVLLAIILGLFISFLLPIIVNNALPYDTVNDYLTKINLTKDILKTIIYLLFFGIVVFEANLYLKAKNRAYISIKSVKKLLKIKNK